MRVGEDVSEKPEVAGEPEGLTPDAGPEEEWEPSNGVEDEDLSAATEDPARSLKEPGSE